MKKIVSIVGARPQFIKLSSLSKRLAADFNEVIIHTGQHYDRNMSDVFFKELGISKPDYNLDIGSGGHGVQTGEMMIKLEKVLLKEEPDLVIVFGDTNSTIAGALVAAKLDIKVLHIEAGLRSFNRAMPEEINRVATDHISDYLFAPNKEAMSHLSSEGILSKATLTGDIMVDSVLDNASRALSKSSIISKIGLLKNDFYLATLHRPYNVDDPNILDLIFHEFSKLSRTVVIPIHPRTKKIINNHRIEIAENIRVIDPVGYLDFLCLQQNSFKIITDSGGIQKEAYVLRKACITLRSETEWNETVLVGWNLLIDISTQPNFSKLVEDFNPDKAHTDLFGKNVGSNMLKQIKQILQ